MSLTEEVGNVIGYGLDVAGADIDTVARNSIRVVLDRVEAELRRRDKEASLNMTGGPSWLMALGAFREARRAIEASTES